MGKKWPCHCNGTREGRIQSRQETKKDYEDKGVEELGKVAGKLFALD